MRSHAPAKACTNIIIWAALWLFANAQGAELPLQDAIKYWRTVRIVLVIDGGDFIPPAPFILLQRMDAERVVLSTGEHSVGAEYLPVARAVMAPDTAQKIIDRALAFYAQAQKETGEKARVEALPPAEREAIYKKPGFGISAFYIRIEVLGLDRAYQFQDDFANHSNALKEFADFLNQQSK